MNAMNPHDQIKELEARLEKLEAARCPCCSPPPPLRKTTPAHPTELRFERTSRVDPMVGHVVIETLWGTLKIPISQADAIAGEVTLEAGTLTLELRRRR